MGGDRWALLERLDGYLDAVPRSAARTEAIGPFTLFVNDGEGWRFYARPRPGERAFEAAEVRAVLARQRDLDQPRQIEWVADLATGVGAAASRAGMRVAERPLMAMPVGDLEAVRAPVGVEVRVHTADEDLSCAIAVPMLVFGDLSGSAAEAPGRLRAAAAGLDARAIAFTRGRIAAGSTTLMSAQVDGEPVASGSHQPVGGVSEITGVACLPAHRRRGIGAAITSALVVDARSRGADIVCLSAGDDDIARVYERVGFRRVGRVGEATAPQG